MPDWGAIGGGNLATGFLNGFAQSYARSNADKLARQAHQEDVLLNLYSKALLDDPTLSTNPGFHNSVAASGLSPEAAQPILALSQLIAAQPSTQQEAALNERKFQIRNSILAPPPSVGTSLREAGVQSLTSGAPGIAGAVADASAIANEDPVKHMQRKIAENPAAAKLAFEGKVDTETGTRGGLKQPRIQLFKYPVGNETVTEEVTTHPDGTITRRQLGKGVTGKGQRDYKLLDKTERKDIAEANALLETLDQLQKDLDDPEVGLLIGRPKDTMLRRGIGQQAEKLFPGAAANIETGGRTDKQEQFATMIAELSAEKLHRLYGSALTPSEKAQGIRLVPDITMNKNIIRARLRVQRELLTRTLVKKLGALKESGITNYPTIYQSTQDKALARRAEIANRRLEVGRRPAAGDDSTAAEDATNAAGGGDTTDIDADWNAAE